MVRTVRAHWRLSTIFVVFSIGLLTLHAVLGTPEGNSYKFNLPWFDGFSTAFWSGDLYPRYLFNLWYGLGAADFYFYGPLPFWLASTLGQATCPSCATGTVFSISGAWMILLSGVAFFVFARRYFAPAYAGFGAMVYMVLPFHYFVDWYDRQSVGEIASMMILPVLALATAKLIEEKKGGALFAISFAAIALSHMPTTLIVVHLLAALVTWTVLTQFRTWADRAAVLIRFAFWGAIGAALSAIYWVPALALLDSVSPDMLYTEFYDSSKWLLLDGRPELDQQISNTIRSCLLLVVTTAFAAYLAMRQNPKIAPETAFTLRLWIIGPSLFTAFLMTIFSYPIWEFWVLNKIQFPWRTLTVSDLSVALGAIVVAKYVIETRKTNQNQRARLLAGLCGAALVIAYIPQVQRTVEAAKAGHARGGEFAPVAVPEYVPPLFLEPALTRFRSKITDQTLNEARYVIFFEEMRQSHAQAVTWMQDDAPGAVFTPHLHDRSRLQVNLPAPASVRLPIAVWPHWRAQRSDGTPLPLHADTETGLFSIDLPAGRSDISFYVIETVPQKIGSSLSLLALLGLFGYGLGKAYRRRRRNKALSTSIA